MLALSVRSYRVGAGDPALFVMYVRRVVGLVSLSGMITLWTDSGMAQETLPRMEAGLVIGFIPSAGRPHVRTSLYGSGRFAVRPFSSLWLLIETGAAPTSSRHDPSFTINLFFIRTGLKLDLPGHIPGLSMGTPFVTVGVSYLDFDPAGDVDAEDDLRLWGIDGGGGMAIAINRRLGFQLSGHVSVIRTRVEQFPILDRSDDSQRAIYSFLSVAWVMRF